MFSEILQVLETDDNKKLEEIINAAGSHSVIETIPPTTQNLPIFLSHSATTIEAAAFYGAEKCFEVLKGAGFSMEKADSFNTPISHFAVCGENAAILSAIKDSQMTFTGATNIAIENKKINALKWLKENSFINKKEKDARGFNAGFCAALTNDEEIITFLYSECKCFPNVPPDDSNITLFLLKNDLDVAAELTIKHMPGYNMNKTQDVSDSIVSYAKEKGKTNIVELLKKPEKENEEEDKTEKEEEDQKDKEQSSKCCLLV